MLRILGRLERALAGLRLRFGVEGGRILVEAERGFFDPAAPARVEKARAALYALVEGLGGRLRLAGLPYCFLPAAHELMSHPRREGAAYRRPAFCRACRFENACPGLPLPRGKADAKLLRDWFCPLPHGLDEIAIEATGHCNLECGICLIVNTRKTSPPAADLRRVIDEAKAAGAAVVRFTGGEPMLRKDLFELARYARGGGLKVYLNTNGSLLDAKAIAEMESCVDSVLVSVQGHDPESEQRLTGGGALYRRKLENLARLAASKVPVVRVDTIMSKTLLARRERYVALLRAAGVRHWVLTRPMHRAGAPSDEYRLTRAEFVRTLRFLAGLRGRGLETYVGNAVPFCVDASRRHDGLFAANSLTEARRLVYDCRGFYKPTYEMNVDLGRSLSRARRSPFLKKLWSLERVPAACADCAELKSCLGGNRFMAREASGADDAPDPLMGEPIRPDRCKESKLDSDF